MKPYSQGVPWSPADADGLLRAAFPWGAHVTVNGSEFVSLRYEIVDDGFCDNRALIRFERDPGDTLQWVSKEQLTKGAETGFLVLDGAAVRQPTEADLHLLASPFRDFIGPQPSGERGWIARMRLHQSWWRAFRVRTPFGFGPTEGSKRRYGNMLDDEGAARGLNFLTIEARGAFEERIFANRVGVDPWRTSRNLLASQTMAFNLFGHLQKHLDVATGLFIGLLGEHEVSAVTDIEIERLSSALGDHTAFDAFARCERPDGTAACIAIETKLTEPFSQQAYPWERYVAHSAFDSAVWATSDVAVLGDARWSQLWRNHLLARAESAACGDVGLATVLVVHHRLDPHCKANVDEYRGLLHEPAAVRAVDLHSIAAALASVVAGNEHQERWLTDFSDRYLNLGLSERLVGLSDWAPPAD